MCFVTPTLSVVVPAYNEESRLLPTLQKINDYLSTQAYGWEVVVVDDGSTDQTAQVVETFIKGKTNFSLLRNGTNRGKGASVKRGVLAANGRFRLFSDADLSTPIEEVAAFLDLANNGFDVVIGSRRLDGSKLVKRQPFFRYFSGRVFSVLVRLFTLQGYLDTQCGFKLFSSACAEKIFPHQRIPGFGFDVELLYLAHHYNYKVKEAPVSWEDSPNTTVRLGVDSFRMFMDLFRIRLNHLRRKYIEKE